MTLSAARVAYCARHYEASPQVVESDGAHTWITRGVNLVIAVTEAREGTVLRRGSQPDEYMLVVSPGVAATVSANGEVLKINGDSLTIVPPGHSEVVFDHGGRVVRIFTSRAQDLAATAVNAANYGVSPDSAVAPLADWPEPVGGFRIRNYPLAPHDDLAGPRIQPRIFRSTNLMVNAFVRWRNRRDPRELSPHWHADFEQASVGMEGSFVHHIRYPWESNMERWHDDQHLAAGSPSVAIIPPPAVHTTQDVGEGTAWLLDVFAPPRADFSSKPGFVINEADYPMPADLQTAAGRTGGSLMGWQKT
jgi:hypothetical protein